MNVSNSYVCVVFFFFFVCSSHANVRNVVVWYFFCLYDLKSWFFFFFFLIFLCLSGLKFPFTLHYITVFWQICVSDQPATELLHFKAKPNHKLIKSDRNKEHVQSLVESPCSPSTVEPRWLSMDTCIDMSPERRGQKEREREHTLKAAKVSFPIYSIPSAFKVQRASLPGAPEKKKRSRCFNIKTC